MQLLKLVQSKVQVGIPLPWNVRNADGALLLARGHVIQSEQQLETLLDRGAYVDADEVRALAKAQAQQKSLAPALPASLFDLWVATGPQLQELCAQASDTPGFPTRVHQLAEDILALVQRDADVAIYTSVRQERYKLFHYGYTHAVHTAVIGTLISQRLGWPAERLLSYVLAALTMNIAIADLQGKMAGQEIPVLDRQRAAIHKHPGAAVQRLQQLGVTDQAWLDAVAQHHEQSDGGGYPDGRREIVESAQALRMADVFMAKISPRKVRPALAPQEAARQLFREAKGNPVAMAIIKEFGIYPPGEFVHLKSGETAVVVRRSANASTPIVAAITDEAGTPVSSSLRRDTADPAYAIAGTVADKSKLLQRMPAERLYGLSPEA